MAVDHFKRVEEIFNQVLERDPVEREAFLMAVCGEDAALRKDVEDLLSSHEGAGSVFMAPLDGGSRSIAPLSSPRSLGSYELIEEIARGGMGVVYKARHRSLERFVALKAILGGGLASSEEVERFRREARAIGGLDHPHIVPVYEVGEEAGVHFFTMKLMQGGSLSAIRDRFRADPRRAAKLIETIARAVNFAHQRGILHRDLKPANILLDSAGEPHISDFGLAKPLLGDAGLTLTGQVLGTAAYMAPEQAKGDRQEMGAASDVYSLGAILYELLAGSPPFKAESSLEVLRQVVEEEPRPLRAENPEIPPDLEAICLKCLEKQPRNRYSSAEALAADLRRYLAGEPVVARRITALERGWRWCRRNPAPAAVVLLLLSLAVGAIASAFSIESARKEAIENLWDSRLAQARWAAISRRPGQRLEGLQAIREAASHKGSLDLRNAAVACLALADLEASPAWEGIPPGTTIVAFDGSLKRYARGDSQGRVTVLEVEASREIAHRDGAAVRVQALQFSPTGTELAIKYGDVGRAGGLHVWTWAGEGPVFEAPVSPRDYAFDFTPSGREIAFADGQGVLRVCRLRSGEEVEQWSMGGTCDRLRVSPDGKKVVTNAADRIQVWNLPGGESEADLDSGGKVSYLAWHPDGRRLAAIRGSWCALWDVETKEMIRSFRVSEMEGIQLAYSQSGDLLASCGWDGAVRLWSPGGTLLVRDQREAPALFWSGDGGSLGYHWFEQSIGLWRVSRSSVYYTLHGTFQHGEGVSMDRRGRLLASTGDDGIRLWDLDRKREVAFLPRSRGRSVHFHPRTGDLILGGRPGLHLWPVQRRMDDSGEVLRLGPPRSLLSHPGGIIDVIALSEDGSRLLYRDRDHHAILIDLEKHGESVHEFDHLNVVWGAVSRGGRFVATGALHGHDVKVWDGLSGKELWRIPAPVDVVSARVLFSPDGERILISTRTEYSLREASSGKASRSIPRKDPAEIPAPMAFSREGKVVALSLSQRRIQLFDARTLDELVTLESPDPGVLRDLAFSPDGSLLVGIVARYGVQVWDLRALRKDLSELHLDWPAPSLPPAEEYGASAPLRVEVDLEPLSK